MLGDLNLDRRDFYLIKFRLIKNFDEQKFKQHLSSASWHVGEIFDDIEDQTGFFTGLLTSQANASER